MPVPKKLPPYEVLDLQPAGVRLHCVHLPGDGPPLLMLHGIGMDWRVWQAISRRLHEFFSPYMLDLRGHGSSDKPESGYSLGHYAADLEDVLDELALTDVTLLGSSLGGTVAIAVEAPADIVSHRVLIDPPLTGGPVRDASMFEAILELKHGPQHELATYLRRSNPGAGGFYLRTMAEMWRAAADGVITEILENRDRYFDLDAALQADESPTLILRADADHGGVLTEEQARHALSLLPMGEEMYIPRAGHAIHAYKPAEVTRLVREFAGV